jgi:hypothetical protein
MTINVQLTRSVDGPEVLTALAAGGFAGQLAKDGLGLVINADDAATIGRMLDAWAEGRGLPFVPVLLAPTSYALVPPAG